MHVWACTFPHCHPSFCTWCPFFWCLVLKFTSAPPHPLTPPPGCGGDPGGVRSPRSRPPHSADWSLPLSGPLFWCPVPEHRQLHEVVRVWEQAGAAEESQGGGGPDGGAKSQLQQVWMSFFIIWKSLFLYCNESVRSCCHCCRYTIKVKKELDLDEKALSNLHSDRQRFLCKAVENYIHCLEQGREHDTWVFRLTSLWLENAGVRSVDDMMKVCLQILQLHNCLTKKDAKIRQKKPWITGTFWLLSLLSFREGWSRFPPISFCPSCISWQHAWEPRWQQVQLETLASVTYWMM